MSPDPAIDLSRYLRLLAFFSISIAVMVTMIALGVKGPGQGVKIYNLWPKEGLTFQEAFLSVSNIVFAYGMSYSSIVTVNSTDII